MKNDIDKFKHLINDKNIESFDILCLPKKDGAFHSTCIRINYKKELNKGG